MHTKPMAESKGTFQGGWKSVRNGYKCSCGSSNIKKKEWESSCGGYEDTKYECSDCNKVWWVDGPDS